jgi:cysteine desulfurase/selenocysteine lyase
LGIFIKSISSLNNYKKSIKSGTPNNEGILGFGSALAFLSKIGLNNIYQHELELKKYFDKRIKEVKNIEYAPAGSDLPVCSFNITGVNPQDLSNYLGSKKIVVRGGMACVKMQEKFTHNKTGYVRASMYLYNDKKDIDVLISALKQFKKGKELAGGLYK